MPKTTVPVRGECWLRAAGWGRPIGCRCLQMSRERFLLAASESIYGRDLCRPSNPFMFE